MSYPIEICLDCDDKEQLASNIQKVLQAGVQRIELCSSMSEEGLTPDMESIVLARKLMKDSSGLLVMIRPRAGDFAYDESEVSLMLEQIRKAALAGADGVVLGILNKDQSAIETRVMERVMMLCRTLALQVTFHRAFDALNDSETALQQLIALGVNRVLTSGTCWGKVSTALHGQETLLALARLAKLDIEIVIAGGINPQDARTIGSSMENLNSKVSFHAYSSVLNKGAIDSGIVKALVSD